MPRITRDCHAFSGPACGARSPQSRCSMRLFLAIDLPQSEREALRKRSVYRDWFGFEGGGVKWVRPENLHLTLKFLGEVEPAAQGEIVDRLSALPATGPITLRSEGITCFPPRGPIRVVVEKIGGEVEKLAHLHRSIECVLDPLGFPPERRPFTPHVTLARAGSQRAHRAGPILERVRRFPAPPREPFTVGSFVLYQSVLKPSGSEYTPLATFALAST